MLNFYHKLLIRLQRDLTDSTVIRNIGTAFGHTIIAFKNIITGLTKIDVNIDIINIDISKHQVVLIEGGLNFKKIYMKMLMRCVRIKKMNI